jgi:hypothetical protein
LETGIRIILLSAIREKGYRVNVKDLPALCPRKLDLKNTAEHPKFIGVLVYSALGLLSLFLLRQRQRAPKSPLAAGSQSRVLRYKVVFSNELM